jgi:NitT/TauT family transport system substrate-binding protein
MSVEIIGEKNYRNGRGEALSPRGLHGLMGHFRTNLAFTAVAVASVLLSGAVLFGYLSTGPSAPRLRLGFFPNVTHAQALYGLASGIYQQALQQALGTDFTIEAQAFNAGPDAIIALLSHKVDLAFVGPSPTLNGLSVAPDIFRVIAGASSGGALFVVQPYVNLTANASYSGKKFATPQWRNTQDIALKHFLLEKGHKALDEGGDVDVINVANPKILTLFKLGRIDGAWVPEPWGTRLIKEANGKALLDERALWTETNGRFITTQLVTTKRYLEQNPLVVTTFLRAYVNVTLRLQQEKESDLEIINEEFMNLTTKALSEETLDAAFANFNLTYDPIAPSLRTYLAWAQDLGFLPRDVRLDSLYDLSLLNQILEEMKLPTVSGL